MTSRIRWDREAMAVLFVQFISKLAVNVQSKSYQKTKSKKKISIKTLW